MIQMANDNDVAYWDYTGGRQFVVSLGIMSHQLKDIPMMQHALKDLNEDSPDLSNSCESICFP